MRTEKRITKRSFAAHLKRALRCSVCGREMTTPKSIMGRDGTGLCDACYRDRFFADDTESHYRLDHCNA